MVEGRLPQWHSASDSWEQRGPGREHASMAWGLMVFPTNQVSRSVEKTGHLRVRNDSVQGGLRIPEPLKTSSTFWTVILLTQNSVPGQRMVILICCPFLCHVGTVTIRSLCVKLVRPPRRAWDLAPGESGVGCREAGSTELCGWPPAPGPGWAPDFVSAFPGGEQGLADWFIRRLPPCSSTQSNFS